MVYIPARQPNGVPSLFFIVSKTNCKKSRKTGVVEDFIINYPFYVSIPIWIILTRIRAFE